MKKNIFILLWICFSFIALQAQETTPLAKDHSKFLGNIIPHYIPAQFDTYWNQVTPENASKWGSIESTRNRMNWNDLDRAYKHARDNGYPFKLHTLVWGSQEPSWITTLSAEEQKAELEEFMQLIANRYPDIHYIDVVNEPLHAPSSIKDAIGGEGETGWDWVIWSFEKAREYFPNAKLHINDYGIISDQNKAAEYRTIIRLLTDRNLIDGIGIQCHHFSVNQVSVQTMKTVLNSLSRSNLPIYVSELDITGKPDWRSDEEYKIYLEDNSEEDEERQYQRYKEKFPVFWEHNSVAGITLWGYIEGATWAIGSGLLNTDRTERKAMKWLKEYMASEESKVPNKFDETNGITFTNENLQIKLYPNPVIDFVTIEGKDIHKLEVYDISGKNIMTETNTNILDLTHLSRGIYIIKVKSGSQTLQQKIQKK